MKHYVVTITVRDRPWSMDTLTLADSADQAIVQVQDGLAALAALGSRSMPQALMNNFVVAKAQSLRDFLGPQPGPGDLS